MPIVINGSGSVTGITTRLAAAAAPAGSVIQTVSSVKTDSAETLSTSFADIAGTDEAGSGSVWECNITPSAADSKVLVFYALTASHRTGAYAGSFQLVENHGSDTAIYLGDQYGSNRTRATGAFVNYDGNYGDMYRHTMNGCFLHSPNTTSSCSYRFQWKNTYGGSGSGYEMTLNIPRDANDAEAYASVASAITLQEIAV